MAALPPVILVLDINALSTATPREWLEFSRVGSCIIPQVVYEEMKFLFDRSPDPDLERIAREFNRFYATSGWKISEAHAHHAVLKSASGQSLTKRARVSLAVGRCAYAISQSFPASLVVLVSSDRTMLQRIYDIQASNLCAVTGQSLLQWCRTGQRPIAVSQKLQRLRVESGMPPNSGFNTGFTTGIKSGMPQATSQSRLNSSPTASTSSTPSSRLTSTHPSRITTTRKSNTMIREASSSSDSLKQLLSLLLALGGLAVCVWLGWLLIRSIRADELNKPVGPSASRTSDATLTLATKPDPTEFMPTVS